MSRTNVSNIFVEDAHVLFKNFSGEERKFNPAGNRNFSVVVEEESVANQLKDDGWNVKVLKARDEDEQDLYYLNVAVSFKNIPPEVWLVTVNEGKEVSRVKLDEDSIGILDHTRFCNVDLSISPYPWSMQDGKSGIKAYLRKGYFSMELDRLDAKYALDDRPYNVRANEETEIGQPAPAPEPVASPRKKPVPFKTGRGYTPSGGSISNGDLASYIQDDGIPF